MKSTTRTFLSVTEIEPRIVPDATATLLPETFGTTTTTTTTLQYVDDPSRTITATTLGFTDDTSHPITVTPANSSIPPTAPTPPTDTTPSAAATPDVLALPPEFLAWIETLSDDEIQYLLSLSDAELGAFIAGAAPAESPATPVAGPSLPADITPTLHGVDVGTSLPTPATGPNVVNTVYHFDPNAPPPTATTLEFTNGQQQGPLITLAQNPAQPPPMTPAEALNRLQNQPQIVVVGDAPPVVQAAAAANAVVANVPTTIRPGDEWLYSTTANGMYVPFMTKVAYAKMIADNIAANATAPATGFWNDVGDWIPFNQSVPYIVGTVFTGYVWNFAIHNPMQAQYLYDLGTLEGVNNIFIQPTIRTAQFVWDVPNAIYDLNYVPYNPYFAAYLNGSTSLGAAVLFISLDATSVIGTGILARGAIRGVVASRLAAAATTPVPGGPAYTVTTPVPGGPAYTVTTPVPGGPAFTVTTPVPTGPAFTVTTTPVPGIPVSPPILIAGGARPSVEPPVPHPVPPPVEAPPPVESQSIVDAVGQARTRVGGVAGDCEQAVSSLIDSLPGGTSRSLSVGEIGFHEVYIYQGRVIDAVAAQYIRNAAMLQQVEQAGLKTAMESGVFTVAEHIQFMRIVRGEQFTLADYIPQGR